jgi:hypothetical protein
VRPRFQGLLLQVTSQVFRQQPVRHQPAGKTAEKHLTGRGLWADRHVSSPLIQPAVRTSAALSSGLQYKATCASSSSAAPRLWKGLADTGVDRRRRN